MPFLGKQPTAGFASIIKDDLTGNGTTGPYTLSKQVANANDIAVFVGNVRQEPTDAYTVSGNQLTMTGAVSSSQNFYVLHIAGTVESSVVPADGTITNAKIVGMASSKLTGALPAIDGSALTGISTINEIDSWEMNTSFTPGGTAFITSNWARSGDTAFSYLGTGLTESSGVFSFPSTGIYYISFHGQFNHNGNDGYVGLKMYVTTDNSTYTEVTSISAGNRTTSDPTMSTAGFAIVDVTNTSNIKFKFEGVSLSPCALALTQFYSIRLGDT